MKMGNSTHISPRASVVMDSSVEYSRIVTPQEKCIYYVLDSSGNVETTWYNGHELSQGDIFSFAGSPKYEKPKYDADDGTKGVLDCMMCRYIAITAESGTTKKLPFYISPTNADLSSVQVTLSPVDVPAASSSETGIAGITIDDDLNITIGEGISGRFNISVNLPSAVFYDYDRILGWSDSWTGVLNILSDDESKTLEVTQLEWNEELQTIDSTISLAGENANFEMYSIVKYSSSDQSVAVYDGFHQPIILNSGTTTITAETKYSSKTLEVSIPESTMNIASASIDVAICPAFYEISSGVYGLLQDAEGRIYITLQPAVMSSSANVVSSDKIKLYPKVEWSTSDDSVISIREDYRVSPSDISSAYVISCKAVGAVDSQATITATCAGYTASIDVIVVAHPKRHVDTHAY